MGKRGRDGKKAVERERGSDGKRVCRVAGTKHQRLSVRIHQSLVTKLV
jgi:hypothetical protein